MPFLATDTILFRMHHHGQSAWIVRLLRQVKVGQHNVAGLVQQNIYSRR